MLDSPAPHVGANVNGGYPSHNAISTPPITSDRKPTQLTTRHSRRGRTGRERPDVEADVDEGGPRLQAATDRAACAAAQQQHQPHPPATRHSPQRTAPRHGEGGQRRCRNAAPRHTAGGGPRPGPTPAAARPAAPAPHATLPRQHSPANNNRMQKGRMSCHRALIAAPSRRAAGAAVCDGSPR